MTVLQSMLESPQIQRLGWALLHSLWEGAAVAVALVVALRLLRGATASVRYVVACAAMLAAPALPVFTFLIFHPTPAAQLRASTTPPASILTAGSSAVVSTDDRTAQPPGPAVQPKVIRAGQTSVAQASPAPRAMTKRPVASRFSDALHAAAPWLVLVWACGVALLSLRNLGGWIAIQRLKAISTGAIEGAVCDMADRLCRRLNLNRAVRLLSSAKAVSPMVIGAFKPVILLPASVLCELSAAQLESILAHELAHVRRHDYLANLLQSVIETLMFYHPAIWWIGRRIRIERENCCDDIAVSLTRDRVTYVRALALVAGGSPALAPAATGGALVIRVRRILGAPERDAVGAPRWLSGVLVLATVVSIATLLRPHERAAAAAPAKPPQTQPASIEVTIVDQESGRPVPGVSIRPYIQGDHDPRATTDANGRAELRLPPNTVSMNLWARKDGYVPTIARFDKGTDAIPPRFTMRIERGVTIGGAVIDEQRNPIAGAAVFVWADPGSYNASQRISTQVYDDKFVTDAQGKWRCSIIPKGAKQVSLRLEHPDYASDARYEDSGKPSLDDLLKMSDVLVLKKGFAVTGRILDADGKPIKEALVALGGHFRGMHGPTARSDANGGFVLPHCRSNEHAQMVVTAKGHCPAVEQFPLQSDRSDMEVRLNAAKPLIVRVVNPQGQPLPNSRLFIQRWRNGNLIDWDSRTDAQGRAVWNEAPDDTVYYCISREGYVQLIQAPLVATGREQTITLLPEVKVSGSVVDDITNKPLQRFHVVRGWTSPGREEPLWEPDGNSPAITGQDGKFELTEATEQDGYAIRIEADGYQPADSKVFHKEDGNVALAFRVKKAADISQTLVTPDGRPLSGADVLVVTGSSQIDVKDGSVRDPGTFTVRTKSDSAGRFRLAPQGPAFRLMVVHNDGYAELAAGDFGGPNPIVVAPWARVEGIARVGAMPAAGRMVVALLERDNPRERGRVRLSSEATVASDGSYRIDRVPPGAIAVSFIVPLGNSGVMSSYGYAQRTSIRLAAGETMAHVDLGGKGRPIVGRVVTPPSVARQIDWASSRCDISTRLHLPGRVLPPQWDQMVAGEKADWERQWQQSPAVVRYESELKTSHSYPFKLEPDGSFRVDDVQAGTYELTVQARDGSSPPQLIAAGKQEFTVDPMSEGRSDQPLDLGSIGVVANRPSKMGEAAPALDVPGVDGKRIRLADLRGKYVLVDFWATWCGPCVAETPFLKSAWAAFGSDPRFAMISLSLDEKPDAPLQFAANQQIPWTQGFLGPWSQTEVPNQWGVEGIPSIFLVGPDGKILARDLRGDAIKAAVTQYLGARPAPTTAPSTSKAEAPQQPRAEGTLSGTVVDAQDHPIAGAKVVFTSYNESLQREVPTETVTDAAGHFRIGPVAPAYRDHYDLEIDAEGIGHQYIPEKTYSVYPGADTDLGRIQVDKGRVFSGQVLDWDGKPVSGANIECKVYRLMSGYGIGEVLPMRKLSTDAAGRFKTPPLPVGLLSIDVYAPNRQRAGWGFKSIASGGEEELKPVRLKQDVPIAGTIRDEQGQPISGARVSANDYPEARSDDAGRFVLHGFGPDPQFQFVVRKPGFVLINWAVKQMPEGWRYLEPPSHSYDKGPLRRLDVVLQREAWVQGRAIDAETGEPVRLERVVMCQFDRQPDGHILLSNCRNGEFEQSRPGEFRISYDSPAEYHLTLSAPGYDDAEAFTPKVDHLQPIGGLVVKMKRQTGAEKVSIGMQRIGGTVMRDGQPVKTGWVGLWGLRDPDSLPDAQIMRGRTVERERIIFRSAPIDNGAYTLDVPNPGNGWYVVAEEPGRAITQLGPITVAADESKTLNIHCIEGGGIRGHVNDIPAAWAASVWVVAFNRTGVRAESRVDARGNFTLANLPPGEYGLKAGYDGFRDSEVPKDLTPKDWKTPADPWRRAMVVKVEPARETADVRLTLPAD